MGAAAAVDAVPEVTVDRFVAASPPTVRRALDPAAVVEYEGSFAVEEVHDGDDPEETVVVATAGGVTATFRFREAESGLTYEQVGDAGPFDDMETTLSVTPEAGGSRVTATSSASLGLPLPFVDRVTAWKRRRELDRALAALAADVE